MADRRRGATIRAYLFGAATAVLVFTMGMPAIVSADGGQTELIHACLLPDEGTGANVVIIGASESCPGGTASLHWVAGENPDIETPPVPQLTQQEIQVPPKVKRKLYGPAGIRIQKTTTISRTLGPTLENPKELVVSCIPTHPFAVWGYAEVLEPNHKGEQIIGGPAGWHGWWTVFKAWEEVCLGENVCYKFPPDPWTLRVTLTCAMVKKEY